MIQPRIYRAAFLPALLAVVIAAFSLEGPPPAAPQGLPADVLFDGSLASSTVNTILQDAPDRRAGRPGDERAANRVATTLRGLGYGTSHDRFTDDGVPLDNVIGRRPGLSEHELVVLANRDALSVPDATGSAADTAALIAVGRVFSGRAVHKTIVLASVDGGSRGNVGAQRFVDAERQAGRQIDAVIVLSATGAPRSPGSLVIDWSGDTRRGGLGLHRTASDSLRAELGTDGGSGPAPLAQLARLAFPVGIGAQGPLLTDGAPAVRISGSGELAPPPAEGGPRGIDSTRYGAIGRSVLRIISALDGARQPPPHGPRAYLTVGGQVMPGWALALLAATLILPALIASIDALARVRRRGHPVVRWFWWVAAGVVPFLAGLGAGKLLVVVGLARDAPGSALDPRGVAVNGAAAANVAVVAVIVVGSWVLLRSPILLRVRPLSNPSAPGAAVATALAMCAVTVGTFVVNPYAALLLALPLNCWMVAVLTDTSLARRAVLVAIGLLPGVLVVAVYMNELDLGPLGAAWYLFLLVTGGAAGIVSTLLGCAVLGVFASVLAIVVAHARPQPPEAIGEAPRRRPGPPVVTPRPGGRSVRREESAASPSS